MILKNLRVYTEKFCPRKDINIKEMYTLTLAREALVRGQNWFHIGERGCCFL